MAKTISNEILDSDPWASIIIVYKDWLMIPSQICVLKLCFCKRSEIWNWNWVQTLQSTISNTTGIRTLCSQSLALHLNGVHMCEQKMSRFCWEKGPFLHVRLCNTCFMFKEALDNYQHHPPHFFPKKLRISIPLEVLAWVMTACWVLRS